MAEQTIPTKFKLRHDIATNWKTKNPILLEGEVGFEIDTLNFKVGDGNSNWNNLNYYIPGKVSQLENDNNYISSIPKEYITESTLNEKDFATNSKVEEVENSIPKSLSELSNDENFIKNTVNDLVNYYSKTQTYTKNEVHSLISSIDKFKPEIVESLPTENVSTTTIYLIAKTDTENNDYYDEYLYINNAWEKIGSTKINFNPNEYLKVLDVEGVMFGSSYFSETTIANNPSIIIGKITSVGQTIANMFYSTTSSSGYIRKSLSIQKLTVTSINESANTITITPIDSGTLIGTMATTFYTILKGNENVTAGAVSPYLLNKILETLVTTDTEQTIAGAKTFSGTIIVPDVTIS